MKPFTTLEGVACPLPLANIDTDQIIAARFMKRPRSEGGYGQYLLYDFRYDANGRQINWFPRKVAALGIAELAVVSDSAMTVCSAGTQTPVQQLSMCSAPGNKVVAFDGDDFQPDEAIIN